MRKDLKDSDSRGKGRFGTDEDECKLDGAGAGGVCDDVCGIDDANKICGDGGGKEDVCGEDICKIVSVDSCKLKPDEEKEKEESVVSSKESVKEEPRKSFGPGPNDEVWIVFSPKAAELKRMVSAQISLALTRESSTGKEIVAISCDTQLYPAERSIEMTTETDEKRMYDAAGAIKVTKE